jgi:DNA-directed RNA polymerase specialized sigma24 family protein
VLILREFHDRSYEELAAALGTTRTAIKSILFRARAAFKELWEQRHGRPFAAEGLAS